MALRFQERDGEILATIHRLGGVIARRQLKQLFWPEASWRAMEVRLKKLRDAGYIEWPSLEQRRTRPVVEPVVWHGWQGALYIAGLVGVDATAPVSPSDYQLGRLQKTLRARGIRWLREPRWLQLMHDLAVVDFHLAIERTVIDTPALSLEAWINEGDFLSEMDTVEFELKTSDGSVELKKRGVRPDGYFVILDETRQKQGLPARARFLLELDTSTEDNPRFGRDKALPGAAYIQSDAYRNRFGDNSGRWLVVTTGEIRIRNLINQVTQRVGSDDQLFWFTTLGKALHENVIGDEIWWRPGRAKPVSLFS